MDPFELHERKRQAWMRLRAQRQRAGQLRGRVVVLSLITFALLWGIVFAQMATGNDPVLGDASHTNSVAQRGAKAKGAQAEGGARTDAEIEAEAAAEFEAEIAEEEPAEVEIVEPEPEPLISGQS
jgi:hypothetical protein